MNWLHNDQVAYCYDCLPKKHDSPKLRYIFRPSIRSVLLTLDDDTSTTSPGDMFIGKPKPPEFWVSEIIKCPANWTIA